MDYFLHTEASSSHEVRFECENASVTGHGVTCNGKSVQLSISAGNPDGKTCWAMCLGSYWS